MAAMTYASLQTDLAGILARSDLTTDIQRFIEDAEFRIARELRPRGFEVYVSSTFTSGTGGAIVDQPTRLMTMIGWHVLTDAAGTTTGNYRRPILRRTYPFVRAYWPDQTATGRPKFYADMGPSQWIVCPTPSAAFVFNLGYYERLAPLSGSNTTNWLTANCPDLLRYAALLESAPRLKDDPRIPMWKDAYDRLAQALTGVEKVYDSDDASAPRR